MPTRGGPHARLPLDDTHPIAERIALLGFWLAPDFDVPDYFEANDPVGALTLWRIAKLERGLLKHPKKAIRLNECKNLAGIYLAQVECLNDLSAKDVEVIGPDVRAPVGADPRRCRHVASNDRSG